MKTEETVVSKVEASVINLNPGDTLFVTIKCDDITVESLEALKLQFGKQFPNNKVVVFGMGTEDDVKLTVVTQSEVGYSENESNKEKE